MVRKIAELLRAAGEVMANGEVEPALDLLADARRHRLPHPRAPGARPTRDCRWWPPRRSGCGTRPGMRQMAELVDPLDKALRSTRVLVRQHRGGGLPPARRCPTPTRCSAPTSPTPATCWPTSSSPTGWPRRPGPRCSRWLRPPGRLERTDALSVEVVLAMLRSVIVDLLELSGMATSSRRPTPCLRVAGDSDEPVTWVLHVDLDQFIAAVEVLRRPELAGQPVVVGGRGDPTERGVVVDGVLRGPRVRRRLRHAAADGRAQVPRRGVPAGRRAGVRRRVRAGDGHAAVSDSASRCVEVMGWDEAFLGRRDRRPGVRFAAEIRAAVLEATRLHCSVGIGDNKLRAKIATDFGKPRGVLPADRRQLVRGDGRAADRRAVGHRQARPPSSWPRSASRPSTSSPPPTPSCWPTSSVRRWGRGTAGSGAASTPRPVDATPYVPRGARPGDDLPAEPDRLGRGRGGGATHRAARGRGHRPGGPAGGAGRDQGALPAVLHRQPQPHPARADQRPGHPCRRGRLSCSSGSSATARSGCSAYAWR